MISRREATLTPNPVFLDTTFHSPHHFPVQKENISPSRILAAMDLPNQLPSHPPNNQSTPVGKGIDLNSTQQSPMDYRFSVGSLPNWAKAKVTKSVKIPYASEEFCVAKSLQERLI